MSGLLTRHDAGCCRRARSGYAAGRAFVHAGFRHRLLKLQSVEQSVSGWAFSYRVSLRILLAATIWIAWIRVVVPSARATADMTTNHQLTETLDLKCLSPEQAGELISPYVRANGSLYYLPKSALRVITSAGDTRRDEDGKSATRPVRRCTRGELRNSTASASR